MALTSLEILDIIELGLFFPALVVSWKVKRRHDTGKLGAFEYLLVAIVFRVIGAAVGIASAHLHWSGMATAADVISNLTLPFLLAASIELVARAKGQIWSKGSFASAIQFLFLPMIAALIMTIVGRVHVHQRKSPSWSLVQAAGVLFLLTLITLATKTLFNIVRIGHFGLDEKKMIEATAATTPLILARTVYELLCAFAGGSRWVSTDSSFVGAVIVQAIVGSLPEISTVVVYLVLGLRLAPVRPATEVRGADATSDEDGASVSEPASVCEVGTLPPPAYSAIHKS
jgi:hypothetical protein